MLTEADAYQAFHTPDESACAFLEWAVADCGLRGRIRLLDAGCGPGRLLPSMSRLGWKVTGLEPHPDFHRAAQVLASTLADVNVRLGGFLDIHDRDAFEVIACIDDSFQYLLTPADRRAGLERLLEALVPGGLLVLDMANFGHILRHLRIWPDQVVDYRGGRLTRHIQHDVDDHTACWTHTDTFRYEGPDGEQEVVTKHRIAMVSLPEITSRLEEVGLREIRVYPSLASRSEGLVEGPRMVVTARKPGGATAAAANEAP